LGRDSWRSRLGVLLKSAHDRELEQFWYDVLPLGSSMLYAYFAYLWVKDNDLTSWLRAVPWISGISFIAFAAPLGTDVLNEDFLPGIWSEREFVDVWEPTASDRAIAFARGFGSMLWGCFAGKMYRNAGVGAGEDENNTTEGSTQHPPRQAQERIPDELRRCFEILEVLLMLLSKRSVTRTDSW
jgi:hypothetical protein